MYNKILVPLDGSKLAEQVLPYARLLAEATGAAVELARVTDSDARAALGGATAADYLKETAARCFAPSTKVTCAELTGKPAESIVDRAESEPNCLIAMATHGASGLRRWLVGSVALKVVQAARSPLLLVRANDSSGGAAPEIGIGSIIVALDGSELAESVLGPVIELARPLHSEIVLARAWDLPASAYYRSADETAAARFIPTYDQLVASVRGEAADYLAAKLAELRGRGVDKLRAETLEGAAADKIIDLARATPRSLIAMCTHGRSGVRRWVLGSVAENVVRHANNPVLLLRAPD
jgi:nucleotide-binding universal stress UspA family protein